MLMLPKFNVNGVSVHWLGVLPLADRGISNCQISPRKISACERVNPVVGRKRIELSTATS